MQNPVLGVFFHWLGGLAAASFYLPYRFIQKWSWETYWLVGGVFSWIVAPWIFASLLIPGLGSVLSSAPADSVKWAFIFGALWGIGGLTFGLTMRYLGIALGMAIALGYCAAFGTLMVPLFTGPFPGTFPALLHATSGRVTLAGVLVCLVGIAVSGLAGMSKEREMPQDEKTAVIKEFSFPKGLAVATFSGILSSCMAYGMAAGKPIAAIAKVHLAAAGGSDLWQNLPVLIIILSGGFMTNFIWCVILNIRNKSGGEYLASTSSVASEGGSTAVPVAMNCLFAAIAGITWYLQFFFYSMGTVRMGKYDFSSWTLHMASIIIFSSLWGIALHEWRGTSKRTHLLIALGLAILIGSTVIVGYGNYLAKPN